MPQPFIPTVGAVRTAITLSQAEGTIQNIFWFTREAAWTQAQREALNTALETWWTTNMKPLTASTWALTIIETVNQDTQNAPSSVHIVSPVVSGNVAGGAYPGGTALCASLRTDLRGRNYRGRSYCGGLPTNIRFSDGTASAAHVANLIAALAALKTVIEGLGAVWVVVSKYLNNTARPAGLKTPITAVSMDTAFDSQRRRLFGRGA